MPGEVTIEGAQGTFTTDAEGIPLTYTTAPGDTERQIAFRFGVPEIADLSSANRPLTGGDRVWYAFLEEGTVGELAPGQTISLNLTKPIHNEPMKRPTNLFEAGVCSHGSIDSSRNSHCRLASSTVPTKANLWVSSRENLRKQR